eukprot:scaffold5303_cov21-Tisochrysis_lutea.AAC.4
MEGNLTADSASSRELGKFCFQAEIDVDLVHVWRSLLAACEMPAPGKAPTQAAASRRHSENGQGDADGQEDVDMECDAGGLGGGKGVGLP